MWVWASRLLSGMSGFARLSLHCRPGSFAHHCGGQDPFGVNVRFRRPAFVIPGMSGKARIAGEEHRHRVDVDYQPNWGFCHFRLFSLLVRIFGGLSDFPDFPDMPDKRRLVPFACYRCLVINVRFGRVAHLAPVAGGSAWWFGAMRQPYQGRNGASRTCPINHPQPFGWCCPPNGQLPAGFARLYGDKTGQRWI